MNAAPDTIVVTRAPGETRSALLAGDGLVEIVHRRDAEIHAGDIYLGRAGARVPGISAVFVHIGDTLPGVLQIKPPLPAEGKAVAVRVVVPARGDKGAVLAAAESTISGSAPRLLQASPDRVETWAARYRETLRRVVCDSRRDVARLQAFFGATISVESSRDDLFASFGVDEAIEAALQAKVALPSGGTIMIETTAAVTAIDVNSGAGDPAAANGEAIVAVATELRRRNIAGHIVVDIIPAKGRAALPRLLAKRVADDPVPTQIAGTTPLGMIELTRQRIGLSLAETLLGENGHRLNVASVAYRALRQAVRKALVENRVNLTLAAAPEVIALLQGRLRPALTEAEEMLKSPLALKAQPHFRRDQIDLVII